jgi:hypothetical protein
VRACIEQNTWYISSLTLRGSRAGTTHSNACTKGFPLRQRGSRAPDVRGCGWIRGPGLRDTAGTAARNGMPGTGAPRRQLFLLPGTKLHRPAALRAALRIAAGINGASVCGPVVSTCAHTWTGQGFSPRHPHLGPGIQIPSGSLGEVIKAL